MMTNRTTDRFYPSPAWWLVSGLGAPMDSYMCEDCCKAVIDAAYARHDEEVGASRLNNEDMDGAAETEGALICDRCGVECAYTVRT